MSEIPRVFISYSHDSLEHKKWVLDLATRLRNNGIDAILDLWELKPGDDLPHFMETNLVSSKFVIMVCTSNYVEKANAGSGGVGYEKMIITSNYLKKIDENKVIPIVRQKGTANVPTFLTSKLYINFSRDDDFEFAYDELVRTIHNSPLFIKPEVGNHPFKPKSDLKEEKKVDSLRILMSVVVALYERNRDWLSFADINEKMNISRIMLELIIGQAIKQGLLIRSSGSLVALSDKGKLYAVENGLISK